MCLLSADYYPLRVHVPLPLRSMFTHVLLRVRC